MKKNTVKLNIFVLSVIMIFATNYAYGGYDVVSAKTVKNDNVKEKKEPIVIPTANDPDLPNFSEEQSVASAVKKKSKKLFRKRKKSEILPQDEVINEDKNSVQKRR